jgi:cell division septation protein DedD
MDSLVSRVQQLVNLGNRTGARALADSALVIRTAGTHAYAEALYARALATADAASAERDYLRVGVEYPLSARAEAAIMMAGQLKMSRGDRTGARQLFERLALDFSNGAQAARAGYWAGRLALEDGDVAQGCQSLLLASERVSASDVEFRNQVEYLRARCTMPTGAPAPDSARASEPPASEQDTDVVAQTEYSVQVAAYTRKRDADAAMSRLRARGFQVRVVGTRAPYRVRVGRYATREDAVAAQGRMRRAGVTGTVVEAEPDES